VVRSALGRDAHHQLLLRAAAIAEIGWTPRAGADWHGFLAAWVLSARARSETADVAAAPPAIGPPALWWPGGLTTGFGTGPW